MNARPARDVTQRGDVGVVHHRRVALRCQVALAAALILNASGLAAQSLRLAVPATTVPAYDTLSGIVATLIAVPGGVLPDKTRIVSWGVRPQGVLHVIWTHPLGQQVSFEGIAPGVVDVFASWVYLTGERVALIQDSVRMTVTVPTHILIPFNTVVAGVPSVDPALISPTRCLKIWETDKHGGSYTGIAHGWSTNDTLLLRTLNSSMCPDTSETPR